MIYNVVQINEQSEKFLYSEANNKPPLVTEINNFLQAKKTAEKFTA